MKTGVWMSLAATPLALALCVPAAPAQSWHDDFDGPGYTPGNPLPSPWIDGTYAPVSVTDYGTRGSTNYTAAYYFGNYNDHRWGASFRPLDLGAGTVTPGSG
jgi:hypothetical protein